MLTSYFGDRNSTPAVPCVAAQKHQHRPEWEQTDFSPSPMTTPIGFTCDLGECLAPQELASGESLTAPRITAAVTKLLDRKEMQDPRAIEAIQAEGKALIEESTWLEESVIEKSDLREKAQNSGETIHLGELLTICSIKFHECVKEMWKWKGRICFRGDIVKDADGAWAVFQELTASPVAIQDANANVAYGAIPGHKTTVSDAVRAYIQSLLNSKHRTYVAIPHVLWPKHWFGKYKKPMCLLKKALYGHPESGAHWERHLTEAVTKIGGVKIDGHPSSFWFENDKLLLSVYVDDLLLSGPEDAHEAFWKKLASVGIRLDAAEPLDRFLGRNHLVM